MQPRFPLRNAFEATALAVVAAHGSTDVTVPGFGWSYAGALLLLPDAAATPLFLLASALHFAFDFGLVASLALHWLALGVAQLRSAEHGLQIMFLYLLLAHVPLHYRRCLRDERHAGLAFAAVATLAAAGVSTQLREFELSHWKQKIVIAHVVNEFVHAMTS